MSTAWLICVLCKKQKKAEESLQLLPCLHCYCQDCHKKALVSKKMCVVNDCYSALRLPKEQTFNECDNEDCLRRAALATELSQAACGHDLCTHCWNGATRREPAACPCAGCGLPLSDDDDKEACEGTCKKTFEAHRLLTASCCGARYCLPCFEQLVGGPKKEVNCGGKCPPRGEILKRRTKKKPAIKALPCSGEPDCKGTTLRNFPSEKECEHEMCLACLAKMIQECETTNQPPTCRNELCRLPYRLESVVALKALFPNKSAYFNSFQLERGTGMSAIRDDSVTTIQINPKFHAAERRLNITVLFCEDEEPAKTLVYDSEGTLGDLVREGRALLNVGPVDKVYGYFRRRPGRGADDADRDERIVVDDKTATKTLKELGIIADFTLAIDNTGIVNQKSENK